MKSIISILWMLKDSNSQHALLMESWDLRFLDIVTDCLFIEIKD